MSVERDLLRRVKVLLECSNMEPLQKQADRIIGEIKELLEQPEQEPFIFKDRESTGSLIAHDAMYKKGYARGFAIARKDYKQKVINAFGSEDE